VNEILSVHEIAKVYGKKELTFNALKKVSFSVKEGEFVSIVGPSGSGKSTLLNIIGGLDFPSSGNVFLNKKNIYQLSPSQLSNLRRDQIGFVFQAYNLIPVLSIFENIEYILILQGVSKDERRKRVINILDKFGIKDKLDKKPPELSGGQQQRVAVARALVSNPSFVLADEPTANLDSVTGLNLIKIMQELNQESNATFIFSTHDPLIMQHAKRMIYLKDGCIEKDEQKK